MFSHRHLLYLIVIFIGSTILINRAFDNKKKTTVIVITYWRTGSTFYSRLIRSIYKSRIYYAHEPFHYLGIDNVTKSIHEMNRELKNIWDCKIRNSRKFYKYLNETEFGSIFLGYNRHMVNSSSENGLKKFLKVDNLDPVCRKADLILLKLVRYPLDFIDDILREKENLKIIYLVRDPRSIIGSRRVQVKWCKGACIDYRDLCSKMVNDLKHTLMLQTIYPKRVKIQKYEDVIKNSQKVISELANFIQMVPSLDTNSERLTVKAKRKKWMHTLSEEERVGIEKSCAEIIDYFGYSDNRSTIGHTY